MRLLSDPGTIELPRSGSVLCYGCRELRLVLIWMRWPEKRQYTTVQAAAQQSPSELHSASLRTDMQHG